MKRKGWRNPKLGDISPVDSDRPTNSTSMTITKTTSKNYEKRFERRLVKYEALPEYLKDNEFIRDYYRSEWPLKEVLLSVFSWHNETLNIWTHLLGFLMFAGLTAVSSMEKTKVQSLITSFFVRPEAYRLLMITVTNGSDSLFPDSYSRHIPKTSSILHVISSTDTTPKWPWFVFLGGAMACLICSSISHLFACHSRSFNFFFWRLDYAGIALMIVCSFFAPIYNAFTCHPISQLFYLTSIALLGILVVLTLIAPALSAPQFRSFRASLFLAMGFSGIIPAVHALLIHWRHPQILMALWFEIIMAVSYAVGALFYMSRVPERWKPGAFDIAGHSHQIFHVFVVAGAVAHAAATLVVMDLRRSSPSCEDGGSLIWPLW